MIRKVILLGAVVAAGGLVIGLLLFGTDLFSYVSSSARSVRTSVRDSVPLEFDLRRAQDLIEDIVPEMHANIRLIAQEEVEVASLKEDIAASTDRLRDGREAVARLRDTLGLRHASYVMGERRYSHQEIKAELARRFERVKEAEMVLAGKHRLLEAREKSLRAAMDMLAKSRAQKALLEEKLASLEAQHQMVKTAAAGSGLRVDHSKLAQAEKLIGQIRRRLDVAERVLAHEARFTESIPVDTVDEKDLLAEVTEYLGDSAEAPPAAVARAGEGADLAADPAAH